MSRCALSQHLPRELEVRPRKLESEAPLGHIPFRPRLLGVFAIGFRGMPESERGSQWLLVGVDSCNKYVFAAPFPDNCWDDVAGAIVRRISLKVGRPPPPFSPPPPAQPGRRPLTTVCN